MSTTSSRLLALVAVLSASASLIHGAQLSIGIDHDMSKPTFGFQGPSSSHITFSDRNGLNMKGTINDLLGPPIKMVNGLNQMMSSSQLANQGQQLSTKSAVLGFDAKLLEAAGVGAGLLKNGLLGGVNLLGGGLNKGGQQQQQQVEQQQVQQQQQVLQEPPPTSGQKIASIIEMPVNVVPLLAGAGRLKEEQAAQTKAKGEQMMQEASAMKQQGHNKILEGASESVNGLSNFVQEAGSKASAAIKLLPIILDLPQPQVQQQQVEQQSAPGAKTGGRQSSGLTGGSFFGGLGSLLSPQDPLSAGLGGLGGLGGVGGSGGGHHYAAVLNSTNPLGQLLMGMAPQLGQFNPMLYPLQGGPLAQALEGKMGGGGLYGGPLQTLGLFGATQGGNLGGGLGGLGGLANLGHKNGETSSFNLLPGLRVRETVTSHLPGKQQPPVQQQQQTLVEQKS